MAGGRTDEAMPLAFLEKARGFISANNQQAAV
jgi:hypothetical protein